MDTTPPDPSGSLRSPRPPDADGPPDRRSGLGSTLGILAVNLSASQSLRSPVVWAPAGADFLCVEPQSHAIGAPSEEAVRKVTPLRRLEPGETLSGWMRIAPQKL